MPETVRAIIVDPSSPHGLAVKPVELAPANPDDVTVRVTAISLNRGEVRRATSQGKPGDRPGWDFSGIVEQRAANGSGPPVGSRVVGLIPSGAWAERLRAPSHAVTACPTA
jgi:NADPH2:quinone reductase